MIKEGLQDLTSAMFGAWTPNDGCADDEITAAEDRLGISLPDALRDYYTVAGRHPELMGMDGREHTLRLSAPRDLSLADGQLVFCGENQGPAAWSVRPDDACWPDPRVHGRAEPGGKWYSEARRLSAFLINVAGRQAVWAAPYQAACRLREDQLVAVEPLLGFIGSREMQKGGHWLSFVDRSSRVVAHFSYITSTLRIGAMAPAHSNPCMSVQDFHSDLREARKWPPPVDGRLGGRRVVVAIGCPPGAEDQLPGLGYA